MTRFYLGLRDDDTWEVFQWDEKRDPTPEETGYKQISGSFPTYEIAEESI